MTKNHDSGKDWSKVLGDDEVIQDEQLDEQDELLEEPVATSLDHPSYKDLEDKLTAAEMKAHEYWDKATRAVAEVENIRRRMDREVENAHKFSVEKIIRELLPVIDSLEHALVAGNDAPDAHQEGIELTLKLFLDVLKKFSVEAVDPMGQLFNPEFHEAMTMQPAPGQPDNTVIAVFQKGYTLHGRVVRPARVVLAKN